ncbi:MAG: hypothetical protein H6733_16365 [Alphaproteobacteria bacterium]|nr:hypothetical protein [Alphaproteobacteria bacterium]
MDLHTRDGAAAWVGVSWLVAAAFAIDATEARSVGHGLVVAALVGAVVAVGAVIGQRVRAWWVRRDAALADALLAAEQTARVQGVDTSAAAVDTHTASIAAATAGDVVGPGRVRVFVRPLEWVEVRLVAPAPDADALTVAVVPRGVNRMAVSPASARAMSAALGVLTAAGARVVTTPTVTPLRPVERRVWQACVASALATVALIVAGVVLDQALLLQVGSVLTVVTFLAMATVVFAPDALDARFGGAGDGVARAT